MPGVVFHAGPDMRRGPGVAGQQPGPLRPELLLLLPHVGLHQLLLGIWLVVGRQLPLLLQQLPLLLRHWPLGFRTGTSFKGFLLRSAIFCDRRGYSGLLPFIFCIYFFLFLVLFLLFFPFFL